MARRGRRRIASIAVAVAVAVAVAPAGAAGWRSPPTGGYFQYQLQPSASNDARTGGIDTTLCARPIATAACVRPSVFDIDLYGPDGRTPNVGAARAIERLGGYAICYVDAGTWERWRPDAARFARILLGRSNGWPGERWLDIAHPSALLALMARRVARCAAAGFQAVEFDNVDAFTNRTGFDLTAAEQLTYNRALAALAHRDGLAAALKNDYTQVAALEPAFDFAIDEQCVRYDECGLLAPFARAGKAVFDVEYASMGPARCAEVARLGGSLIVKSRALLARPWRPCPIGAPRR